MMTTKVKSPLKVKDSSKGSSRSRESSKSKGSSRTFEEDRTYEANTQEESNRKVRLELGYGVNFPKHLLKKMEFNIQCEAGKAPEIKVTRTMLILGVHGHAASELDLGDWVQSLNNQIISNKQHYYSIIRQKLHLKTAYMLKYTVYRTVKTMLIEDASSSPLIPQATEIQTGYQYLVGYITMYPGSSLGVNIKAYNFRVFVTSTDNGFQCLGMRTFLVGDALLAVDGEPQTTVANTSTAIILALKKRKYVSLVIERPESHTAIIRVREALLAEKTKDRDPRMPDDAVQICREEANRRRTERDPPLAGIYCDNCRSFSAIFSKMLRGTASVKVASQSLESTIGMNSVNPSLLQHVPPAAPPKANRSAALVSQSSLKLSKQNILAVLSPHRSKRAVKGPQNIKK